MRIKISPFLFVLFLFMFASCEINPFDFDSYKNSRKELSDYDNVEDDKDKYGINEIEAPVSNERLWNILIYMAADNNLEAAALDDIYEMETSHLNTENISIFILLDRSNGYSSSNGDWSGTRLYKLQTGRNKNNKTMISKEIQCRDLGINEGSNIDLDMSDNNILSDTISFIQERFPANNYGLILWGHGDGWRSSCSQIDYKGFAYDDTNKSYMTLRQLRIGLETGLKGRKLDFLGFDTCFGGELEVMYELRNLCDVAVCSEGLMEIYGWNYNELLNSFQNEKYKTAAIFARDIINSYSNSYKTSTNGSIVSIRMSEIENYFNFFDQFMKSIAGVINTREIRDSVINKVFYDKDSYIRKFAYNDETREKDLYLDISDLVNTLSLIFNNKEIEKNRILFNTAKEKCVIDNWASFEQDGGLGVFFAPLASGNTIKGSYPTAYIKNKDLYQIEFVKDSIGYVPTNNNSGSFLDKLFY